MDGCPSLRDGPRTAAPPAQVTESFQGRGGSGPATHDPEPERCITQGGRDTSRGRGLLTNTGVTFYVRKQDGRKSSGEEKSEEENEEEIFQEKNSFGRLLKLHLQEVTLEGVPLSSVSREVFRMSEPASLSAWR